MRIALVCPYNLDRPGGVATHVLGLARWLNATGHEAKVVAPGTRAPKDVPVLLLGPTRDFRFNGSTAQLAVSASQRTAARAAVQGVDVVHVHEPLTPGAAYTAAKAASPLVVTHHASFTVPAMVAPLLRYRAKKLGPRLSLAVSEAAARTAQAAVGHRPPIIPNAIRLPDARPPLRSDTPRVVFLGRRDDPRKGYAVFHALAQSGIEADFVAIGPGGDPGPGVRSWASWTTRGSRKSYAEAAWWWRRISAESHSGWCSSRRWPPAARSWPLISRPSARWWVGLQSPGGSGQGKPTPRAQRCSPPSASLLILTRPGWWRDATPGRA